MRRSTLILLIVLAIVLLGGGGYLWMKKDTLVWPWSPSSTPTNVQTNTSVGTATNTPVGGTNASLPSEVKGDTEVAGTLKVGTVTVTISSQQKATTVNGATAESGKSYLQVYFDAVQPGDVDLVSRGLRSAVLTDGKTTYELYSLKVASTTIAKDRGYMQFVVPEKATSLRLQIGTGASLQTVPLK